MKLPSSGELDRRITIQRRSGSADTWGGASTTWAALSGGQVWAMVRFVSDGERARAGVTEAVAVARFTVRYSATMAGVTEADRISWGGRAWSITGIKELGRQQFLEITAERTDAEDVD